MQKFLMTQEYLEWSEQHATHLFTVEAPEKITRLLPEGAEIRECVRSTRDRTPNIAEYMVLFVHDGKNCGFLFSEVDGEMQQGNMVGGKLDLSAESLASYRAHHIERIQLKGGKVTHG